MSPDRRQAIILTNDEILLIGLLGTNFSEILMEVQTFSFKIMRSKVSSAKWRPFCLGLNVLMSGSIKGLGEPHIALVIQSSLPVVPPPKPVPSPDPKVGLFCPEKSEEPPPRPEPRPPVVPKPVPPRVLVVVPKPVGLLPKRLPDWPPPVKQETTVK